MGKLKLILGLAVVALSIIVGWQIASCELANLELQEDLRDLAAQTGAYIGLNSFNTDETSVTASSATPKSMGFSLNLSR